MERTFKWLVALGVLLLVALMEAQGVLPPGVLRDVARFLAGLEADVLRLFAS